VRPYHHPGPCSALGEVTIVPCQICKGPLAPLSYDGYVCSVDCNEVKLRIAQRVHDEGSGPLVPAKRCLVCQSIAVYSLIDEARGCICSRACFAVMTRMKLAKAKETDMTIPQGKPFIETGYGIDVEPYRNPSRPTEYDFAVVVFRTDHRVLKHVKAKWEIKLDEHGNPESEVAWRRAMEACYELGKTGHSPEAEWYAEAQTLSERVGKRWDDTPIPTLVEALARKDGQWPLGFSTTIIPPCAMVRISTQPQIPFRGRRLVLGTEETSSKLVVQDIRVGNQSYFCNSCDVPGSVFSDRAFPMWLKMPTAQISQTVSVHLLNISGENVSVTAMLQGDVIEPDYKPLNMNAMYGKYANQIPGPRDQVIVENETHVRTRPYQPKPGERVVYEDSDSVLVENVKEYR
jgi:hypothetical protein